ncbi:glycosyltransferase family 1 protein [Desertihabitans brevis]|uniref:Glycosyltransferase family 1 protein n=1 Tax=Desertihabitans brevis TaxID=2268447 RepID=A0A367YZI3_9ACTN|nr:glycosyltransferase family 4 protein [Desertihabitans brevis]RCK71306.1 glycosyltransferase family 1 protein [Desertihabitans brevis]
MSPPPGRDGLRVGLVCPYALDTPGGVQNHVLGLAAWLQSEGHRPTVLAPGEVPPELHRRYGSPPVTSTGPARSVRWNGSVARVGLDPGTARAVRRWVAGAAVDLLHLHEPLAPLVSWTALAAARTPVVATVHTSTPRSRSMLWARRTSSRRLRRLDAVVAVSEAARRVVVEHLGVDATVIPNGLDLGTVPGRRSTAWRPRPGAGGRPRLAFVGRLDEPRKGLDVLIAAWPGIRARWPDAQVAVAGAGTRRLPAGWTSLGRVSDAARGELLAWCDVFIAPHRERESFGLVLLEALASGAEVVAADLPAFVDVLGDGPGRHAHLFRTGDPHDLVRVLGSALSGGRTDGAVAPPERRVAAVRARYDWSVVGPQVVDVYRAVLASGSR